MAFAWAVEPCAVSLPDAQSTFFASPLLLPGVGVEGLSEPHAASASVAISARPATMPCRFSYTAFPSWN
jgi:hypothetical protein